MFPLNVYAALIAIEFESVTALHYGIFSDPAEALPVAQSRASERLFSLLPPPDSGRVLEVGSGLGETLHLLLARQYDILAINPDQVQVDLSRRRFDIGPEHLLCTGFEQLSLPPASFACIFFQESAQYIDSIVLLQRCADLLVSGGRLVVMDEFMLRCTCREERRLHQLDHFLAHARRCGFTVCQQKDLTGQALPTIEYLLSRLARHHERLEKELAVSAKQLDRLRADLEEYLARYRDGRFGYALLCLEKTRETAYRVLPAGENDASAIQSLFRDVFSADLSLEEYQWKYGHGRGRAMLAWHGKCLVGCYGGVERQILFQGRPENAVQICDVMVAAAHRQRKGPFWLTSKAFAEDYVGFCAPHLLAFGFPNARAMRLGRLLGLYAPVDEMVQVGWPPATSGRPLLFEHLVTLDIDTFAHAIRDLDRLWQAMAAECTEKIIGMRDAAYLRRRYLERPAGEYQLLAVRNRLTGRIYGMLVLREREGQLFVIDLVCRLQDLGRILFHARRICRIRGLERVILWVTRSCAPLMPPSPGDPETLDITVPMISCTPGPSPETVQGRWWLMAGDMDFI